MRQGSAAMTDPFRIRPLHEAAMRAARERQAQLVKPPGSLGRLEQLAIRLAGITGDPRPRIAARVVVAAADHGVAAEGVSAFPAEVTGQMLATFLAGGGAVSVLARETGAELVCVDAGVAADTSALDVVRTGLRPSANLSATAALSREDALTAIDAGRDLARQAAADGMTLVIGGEMGIGNTTPATCLACWLTGGEPAALTGPGTGLDAGGVRRKAAVIERALALHAPTTDPVDALARFGGGEIAVLCGLALGAGEHGLGLVADGLVATAAAADAVAVEPGLRPRLLAADRAAGRAHAALLAHLGLEPVLDLGVRAGDGTGALAAFAVLRLAAALTD
jgi:nicotinate-nucleotide--dimethylbenzimidazole phosphoribosyltransferase